jgi:hypothetical protein
MQAAFQRVAAVIVQARIGARQKRRQRVGVRRMQLGAVESGRTRACDRVAEFLDDAVDLGQRQHIDRLPPTRLGHFQKMDDLRDHPGVRRVMDAPDQIGEARHELIVADAQQRARFGMMDRHGLDHDETGAALPVADIAIDDVLVDQAIFAGQSRHHRAIRDDRPGDVQRLE